MPARFSKISNDIYRGGNPLNDLYRMISKYKIKRIISLDQESGKDIHPYLVNLNVEHIFYPLSAWEKEPNRLETLKSNIVEWLTATTPCYIHCWAGKDRTGLAVALFRVLHDGWSPQKALQEANSFGFGTGLDPEIQDFFIKFLLSCQDKNYTDIVDNAKNSILDNPPNTYPQRSWAPFESEQQYLRPISRSQMMMEVLDNMDRNDSNDEPILGLSTEVSPRMVPDIAITPEKWDDGVNIE